MAEVRNKANLAKIATNLIDGLFVVTRLNQFLVKYYQIEKINPLELSWLIKLT